MRLIDADALIAVIKFLCEQKSVDMITLEAVEAVIDKIAEPQIIRCKDCKYYSRNQLIPPCTDGCVAFGKWYGEDDVSPTDFCSFAERMEVDND